MKRHLTALVVILAAMAAGCTSSDEGATTTSAEPAPAATVAAPETATTAPSTTTTMTEPTSTAVDDERIFGIWRTTRGYYREFRTDGTWSVGYTLELARNNPFCSGTYTFDGGTLTYSTTTECEGCDSMVGIYEVTFSDDGTEQFRNLVDDPCDGRVRNDTPKLTRHLE